MPLNFIQNKVKITKYVSSVCETECDKIKDKIYWVLQTSSKGGKLSIKFRN